MARSKRDKTHFVCQECGSETPRWQGKCPACGTWNSLVEEKIQATQSRDRLMRVKESSEPKPLAEIDHLHLPRRPTHSSEFNRVLGGGIVPGSVILVGGDPGIGKSTLLLQESGALSSGKEPVLYVTGEESAEQIKMRADRLKLNAETLLIMAETEIECILKAIYKVTPYVVIIDSIQTMYSVSLDSAPGSVSQVRECTLRLIEEAKQNNIAVFLVGHVTKEGSWQAPKSSNTWWTHS